MQNVEHYLGNPLLKKSNVPVEWTEEQILEYKKCMENPLHFVQNYIKIVSLDEGLVPFKMFPFQEGNGGNNSRQSFSLSVRCQDRVVSLLLLYLTYYTTFSSILT